jgi:Fungal Zn(2)-Cys(6) binuclear cluster domain/Fungal specific transcription factor domain
MGGKTAGKRKGKPRGIRRDRDCQSCKLRGIKCDLNRPRCQPCVQSGLPCGGYPQRVVWASDSNSGQRRAARETTAATTPALSQESTTPPDDGPKQTPHMEATPNLPMHERYMTFNQYSFIKRLAGFYEQIKDADSQSRGGYLSQEAVDLVSRIWDFIRAKMKGHDDSTQKHLIDSVHFHVEALMRLTEAIDKAHPIALFGIATFAFFEVCDGSFGEWQCHLNGARSLLDFHCRNKADLDRLSHEIIGINEILAHLVWFDTMGAIIRGSKGLIFDDWHRETLSDGFFASVGCPLDTFHLFVTLAKAGNNMTALDLSFEALDQLLLCGEPDSSDTALVENAWRCTAAIAILSQIGTAGSLSRRKALSTAVDKACRVISIIPPTSGIYIHLAATAYLAGIHATHPQQCDVVRSYWGNCRASDFPRYPDGQAKCEDKWRAEGLA